MPVGRGLSRPAAAGSDHAETPAVPGASDSADTPDQGGTPERATAPADPGERPAPSSLGRLSRLGRLARTHWAIVVLVACGALLRIVVQVSYQPALIFIDSAKYLAMSRTYEPNGTSPLGYPVLLLSWLLPAGGLALVVLVQHLLGLAMGVGSYLLLLRAGARRWLAALAAMPVLLDGYQLQIEQNVLSDTLFQALVLGSLMVLLWRRRPPAWALAVGGLLLGLAATVRFVGVVLAVVAICAGLLAGRSSWRRRGLALTLVVSSFAAPLLVYSGWSLQNGKGFSFQGSMQGTLLYARVAPIADCGRLKASGAPEHVIRVCPAEPPARREGSDFYAHDPRSPGRTVRPPPSMSRLEVMGEFGLRVTAVQLPDVGWAIVKDFAKGFAPVRTTAPKDVPAERWRFQLSYPEYPPHDPVRLAREYGGDGPRVNPELARFLRAYQTVGYTPGPVLAAGVIAGLAGAIRFWPRRRPRRDAAGGVADGHADPRAGTSIDRDTGADPDQRVDLRMACLLPAITGTGLLLLAAAFEFSWRYQLPGLVLFPLAGGLGVTALSRRRTASRAGRRTWSRAGRRTDGPG